MKYFFKRKYRQIKNVIKWLPVIWKQYDFDYHYSLEVFKFQLLKQADFMESDRSVGMGSDIYAQKIRMVVRLMEKVYNEEYACEYQGQIRDMYGEDVLDFVTQKDGNRRLVMGYKYEHDPKYAEQRDIIDKDYNNLFKQSHHKQERAHKLLWKLVEFYIRRWWD